jgi:hypothetical protein
MALALTWLEACATFCFSLGLLHSFSVGYFRRWSTKINPSHFSFKVLHFLSEVELVFILWAAIFLLIYSLGCFLIPAQAFQSQYFLGLDFTEAFFVIAIMTICSTQPILHFFESLLLNLVQRLPIPKNIGFYFMTLTLGPLLGSLITEPAAMTLTALLLQKFFFQASDDGFISTQPHQHQISMRLKYMTLGLLFVNISVGGTLTPFAAPPVLMVAKKWGWDLSFMLTHFAGRTLLTIFSNTLFVLMINWKEFKKLSLNLSQPVQNANSSHKILDRDSVRFGIHLLFLIAVLILSHHPFLFLPLFIGFLFFLSLTQQKIQLKEPIFVGLFLAGLVILSPAQAWWLQQLLSNVHEMVLFFGSAALTSITDNAALTLLGSQISGLSPQGQFLLVAGSVVGGGLTVIANAPNPAGYGILQNSFGHKGISPLKLFLAALPLTGIALIFFGI